MANNEEADGVDQDDPEFKDDPVRKRLLFFCVCFVSTASSQDWAKGHVVGAAGIFVLADEAKHQIV
jgi:hypothetical protein